MHFAQNPVLKVTPTDLGPVALPVEKVTLPIWSK
jgi:hypothetical protein